MARRRKPAPDKGEYVSPQPPPEWMEIDPDRHIDDEAVEYLSERAAYIGSCSRPRDQNRLDWLINSHWPLGAVSVGHWKELLSVYYPFHPLAPDETQHTPSEDAKAKAHCLKQALTRLLELTGAPAVIIYDMQILLSGYPLKKLPSYSQAQRELLLDKNAPYRRIARKTGIDQSEITEAVNAGHLIDPWREGRG